MFIILIFLYKYLVLDFFLFGEQKSYDQLHPLKPISNIL